MQKWWRAFPSVLVAGAVVVGASALMRFNRVAADPASVPAAQRQSFKALALPARLPIATGYEAVDAFPTGRGKGLRFPKPLSVVAPPGDLERLFVVSKTGKIDVVTHYDEPGVAPQKSLFMDLSPYLAAKGYKLATDSEWGLLGLAFHPDFKRNGYFYVTYDFIAPDGGKQNAFDRVARFSVSKTDPNTADMTSELPLITQLDQAGNHNGGCIKFGSDGYLYTSIGDEGNGNDSFDNARFIDKDFFAAIFRLDVDRLASNVEPNRHHQDSTLFPSAVDMVNGKAAYKIPADNPFVGIRNYFGKAVDPAKVRTEIYATGLRNTWRFSFDPPTGRLFAGDVGQNAWEEVDLVTKGGNYGWSYREGMHDGPRKKSEPAEAKLIDPIYEYGHAKQQHDDFMGYSVTGGFVYRGDRLTELNGAYVFGDYGSRRVWALTERDGKWTPKLLASGIGSVEFSRDPKNGDVLILDLGGQIRRLVRSGTEGEGPPKLLSEVGAFKNLKTLQPVDGMVAYEPNVSFWSDYAVKQRWFMVPSAKDTIGFDPTANWKFPTGMVWMKQFDIETTRGDKSTRRRLETRFIVKTAEGVYGITYKWRADNSDADLVPEAGLDEVLTIKDASVEKKQTWRYPSQSECLTCHTKLAGEAMGFNTWQMNGNGEGGENQIIKLAKAGYFAPGTKVPDVRTLGALVRADDKTASVEMRARSYLAANCVQCHQPGGVAQGSWDARPGTSLGAAHIVNGALTTNFGDALARVIVPGSVKHSMLLERIQGRGGLPRMPPLATNERDLEAEALLTSWIESLK